MRKGGVAEGLVRLKAAHKLVTEASRRLEESKLMASVARQHLAKSRAALKAAQATLARLRGRANHRPDRRPPGDGAAGVKRK